MARQNIDGLVNFGKTASGNRVSEKVFQAVVVALRVELEQSVADVVGLGSASEGWPLRLWQRVDAEPGQDARKLLDVLLGVAGAHPRRVQLHDLTRIILVEVTVGVLGIVEIAQHRRVPYRRHEEARNPPQPQKPCKMLQSS